MAVASDASHNGVGTTGTTATISGHVATGANRLALIGTGSLGNGVQASGATYDAVAAALVASAVHVDLDYGALWSLVAPPASADVVATWPVSMTSGAAVDVVTFTGVDQTTPLGTPVSGHGSSLTITGQSVLASEGDLVVDLISVQGSGTITATGTGHTVLATLNPYGGWQLLMGMMTGSGTLAPTWDLPGVSSWAHVVVTLKAAPGGGGVLVGGRLVGSALIGGRLAH